MTPLDNLRRLVDGWRGEWRVDAHEGITLSHDGDEWPIADMDGDAVIMLVELLNAIRPAVDGATAEIARLTAELAAARAVPPDVEAAIEALESEQFTLGITPRGDDVPPQVAADRLRTTIARASGAARHGDADVACLVRAVHFLAGRAEAAVAASNRGMRLINAGNHGAANEAAATASELLRTCVDSPLVDRAMAIVSAWPIDSATGMPSFDCKPATVGGLLATAPVGSIVEWWWNGYWYQVSAGAEVGIAMLSRRWYVTMAGGYWSRFAFMVDAIDLRQPARLVPARLFDADPATRGELVK